MGEEECEYDDTGRFYFDHDPTYFNLILNFMRTAECILPYERGAFEGFKKDVQFWRLDPLEARCDVHFKKYIQPQISGEKATGSIAKRKGPNGMAVHSKFFAKQKELHGSLIDKLCDVIHNALMDGAVNGYNRVTVTAYRPPHTIGTPNLPLIKTPEWANDSTLYIWDPTYAAVFQPVTGYPMLYATRDYFVERMEEYGFKITPSFDVSTGMNYDVSGTSGDD